MQLTDFGFARKMNSGYMYDEANRDTFSETYCGSYAYAAPEILRVKNTFDIYFKPSTAEIFIFNFK